MTKNAWQYWREDWDVVLRTQNGRAQTWSYGRGAWKNYDYKADGYLEIGDVIWCTDYTQITEQQAEKIIQDNTIPKAN